MWNTNNWLQLLGASVTILAIVILFALVGYLGSMAACTDLQEYKKNEECILDSMDRVIAAQDSAKCHQISQLYDLTKNLDNDYFIAIEQNYPRLAGLTLVGLLAAIIAGFLNLVAINRGWQNISLTLKISLVTTIFVFIIARYSLVVFQLQEKCEVASISYDIYKKARKDICQFVQTNGEGFYSEEKNNNENYFMSDIYYRLHTANEVRIIPNSGGIPSPLEVHKLLRSQMEGVKSGN